MHFWQKWKIYVAEHSLRELWQELRFIGHYIRRRWGAMLIYLLLGLVSVCMGLGGSVASKYLIDAVTGYKTASVGTAAAAMAGLWFAGLLVKALSSRVSVRVNVRVCNELRAELFSHILRTDWESLRPFRSGDLLNRVNNDAGAVASASVKLLPGLVVSLMQFVGALVIVLVYDPTMALIVLLSVPLSVLLSRALLGRMRTHNKEIRRIDSELMSYNEDAFQNLQTVKAFGVSEQFVDRLQALQQKAYQKNLDYNRFSILTSMGMSVVGMLVYAGCFGWGAYRVWSGAITPGTMMLFLQMSTTVSGAFSSLVGTVPSIISATTSAGRMMELMELPEERVSTGACAGRPVSLQVEHVDFAYRDGGEQVLADLTFSVQPGEMVGIVGPSGEGKTTLIRLLLELLTPTAGRVFLTDAATGEELSASLREACAYVPQGSTLFAGTVADNLRLVREDATDEQLRAALEAAGAWEFVERLPDGLNSPVGEHGGGFSEGQAQRIAIARALLKDAPILLLDEATSALDMEREHQVLSQFTANPRRATVVVTHRPSVLPLCDRIYRIEGAHLHQITLAEAEGVSS